MLLEKDHYSFAAWPRILPLTLMNHSQHVFSVAELAAAARSVLEGCFAFVSVTGLLLLREDS